MGSPLSIRLSDEERGALDSKARLANTTPSGMVRTLIREAVGLDEDPHERIAALEARLARLEEMAGL